MEPNSFARLNEINVSQHIEKKGDFSYLSWPFAVAQLRLADPTAAWVVGWFDGLPYLRTETGYFVQVTVTVQGVALSQLHPVLDSRNRPIAEPTCFDINTSIQRCLVKAIALHGLGLYIYAGEDMPTSESAVSEVPKVPAATPKVVTTLRLISSAQVQFLRRLIREAKSTEEHVLDYFNLDKLEELPMREFDRAMASLKRAA